MKLSRILSISLLCGLVMPATVQADESYCREFAQTFTIDGETQSGYGTACLQPDGSWKIILQRSLDRHSENEVHYIVKEDTVYVSPVRVVFAPGHPWHHKPISALPRMASPQGPRHRH